MKRLDIINKRLREKNKARAFEYFEYLKKKYLKKNIHVTVGIGLATYVLFIYLK